MCAGTMKPNISPHSALSKIGEEKKSATEEEEEGTWPTTRVDTCPVVAADREREEMTVSVSVSVSVSVEDVVIETGGTGSEGAEVECAVKRGTVGERGESEHTEEE